MNLFFWVALGGVLAEFALHSVANLLNLKALRLEVPSPVVDVYEPDAYRKSQEYTRVTIRFEVATSAFWLVVLLSFWFAGGFNYVDQVVRGRGYASIVNGLLYIGILLTGYELLMLPISAYATFVIEERFGFNRTSRGTFALDRVKGVALAALLGVPLLAAVLAFFEYVGPYAWLYCWMATVVLFLVMQFIAPTWILPRFNKFTPMESGELKEAILGYLRRVDFSVRNVYVMDGSKRSSKSNAFFMGFGRNKRIALFDTLIEKLTIPELVAVLAHEVGHYKEKHVWQGMAISIAQAGVIFFLLSLFVGSPGLYQAFRVEHQSVYAGLVLFSLVYGPMELLLSLALRLVSRKNEYQADRFAAETLDDRQSLVKALKKISADNLANLAPHPFYVLVNYSHPPLRQRVDAIQRVAASLTPRQSRS